MAFEFDHHLNASDGDNYRIISCNLSDAKQDRLILFIKNHSPLYKTANSYYADLMANK